MTQHVRRAAILVLALACLAAPSARAAEKLTVFAAASLKNALEAAGAAFTEETGVAVVFSFAGTSVIARQIEAGAPADVFVSADVDWMDHVTRAGAVDAASVRTVAANTLVVVAPRERDAPLDLAAPRSLLARLGDGRLAIADPETVPAGRYGKAALEALKLWAAVEGRLAPMENVRVALAAVARGEAPLGIVYASDAAVEPDVAVVARFPENTHPPIVYPAALTKSASPDALRFLDFLRGAAAAEAFAAAGLAPVK